MTNIELRKISRRIADKIVKNLDKQHIVNVEELGKETRIELFEDIEDFIYDGFEEKMIEEKIGGETLDCVR